MPGSILGTGDTVIKRASVCVDLTFYWNAEITKSNIT